MKLNVGCGSRFLEGYLNVDLECPLEEIPGGIEFREGDARHLGWVADGSVDEVRAEFLLEHFSLPIALGVLYQFWRVLKPGGRLILTMPDFGAIACSVLRDSSFETVYYAAAYLLNVFESVQCADASTPHRSIWTRKSARWALKAEGFKGIRFTRLGTKGWGMRVEAVRGIKLGEEE